MNPHVRCNQFWLFAMIAGLLGFAGPVHGREVSSASDDQPAIDTGGGSLSFELRDPWATEAAIAATHDDASPDNSSLLPPSSSQTDALSSPWSQLDASMNAVSGQSVTRGPSLDKDAEVHSTESVVPVSPSSSAETPQLETPSDLATRPDRLAIPAKGLTPPSSYSEKPSVLRELPPPPSRPSQDIVLDALFQGGHNSMVAIAIGLAEGTRLLDGRKTFTYYGKTHHSESNASEPEWKVGTFALSGEFESPEAADSHYLDYLYRHTVLLHQQATEKNVQWNREIQLNAIDVVHQRVEAASADGGYIDRLHQAQAMGLESSEAILWARTRSVLASSSERWNASETTDSVQVIMNEQMRRQEAIAQFLDDRRDDHQPSQPDQQPSQNNQSSPGDALTAYQPFDDRVKEERWVDELISLDL
ncbi:MAG: hypothetical protein AAFQ57_00445 [Cyanobacteria bacterium J06626_14]